MILPSCGPRLMKESGARTLRAPAVESFRTSYPPRRRRGPSPHGVSTSQPRRRRDPSAERPRRSRGVAAIRLPTEYPRRSRGVAATRPRKVPSREKICFRAPRRALEIARGRRLDPALGRDVHGHAARVGDDRPREAAPDLWEFDPLRACELAFRRRRDVLARGRCDRRRAGDIAGEAPHF